ncbi:MAG: hypothetical protein ACXWZS_07045 [Gemmatirosa sp.]
MTEAASLPAEVLGLIHGPIASMAHAELLLGLRRAAPDSRSLATLAAEAQIAALDVARKCVDELVAAGLAAATGPLEYGYAPASEDRRRAVDALAEMYNTKPVTLIRAIYSRPATPTPPTPPSVQAFADAFRLRREEG